MKYLFRLSITLFIISLFNSCSFVSTFFVQNLTNEDVKIEIEFDYIISEGDLKNIPSLFTSNVDNPKDFYKEKVRNKLEYKKVDDRTILVILPKKSLSKIDSSINNQTNIAKIKISNGDEIIEYDRNQLLKKSRFKKYGILYQIK